MDIPKIIISVTGGAQSFEIDNDTKNAFKKGLIKAAKSTNALIVTGGTNHGVMSLVGEAVSEDFHGNKLFVLGIATWGYIENKNDFIV